MSSDLSTGNVKHRVWQQHDVIITTTLIEPNVHPQT